MGSRLLLVTREERLMADYCSVIEPMMQQHLLLEGNEFRSVSLEHQYS